ncbi:uncharacterized protein LOC130895646 isoform X1 [Diorhabda carinulata]|uniref:uncharacterized protein LOC130895646 isoform X1 n=2 Tax=Diorhabda carinulata TaxID=1163345 RepID=UPI0025A29D46|nr:uncharacterized protein LOC130895646 isoform X1 [Diorhabda carinulata]
MEEIAFSDWPGQPVDLNAGNNSWLPAYGFTAPCTLLEREDFIGNPDAEYFLPSGFGNYMYLETILEETSDDLRSESDADSRGSPVGWLATDSEAGSVICMDPPDDAECDSDREIACPSKRRKQDIFLTLPNCNPEEDLNSLSRSSSLLQFETLEKQCQENYPSSPSLYSQFSYDSLESSMRKSDLSPDSLNSPKSDFAEDETDYYKTLKIDVPARAKRSNDSWLYNANRSSGSDTSESDVIDISRSFDNLKPWRSFESLPVGQKSVREKASAENLSEDSGYSDHLTKSSSTNNFKAKDEIRTKTMKSYPEKRSSYVGFSAYDGDVLQENFNGNFGVSYQDLSILRDPNLENLKTSPLIDHFMKNKKQRSPIVSEISALSSKILKLDSNRECVSNFKTSSSSEPNIRKAVDGRQYATNLSVSSVPKDLNFIGDFTKSVCRSTSDSVASKNWNLADLHLENCNETGLTEEETMSFKRESSYNEAITNTTNYKREGSYAEAMANRVDLSDDEHSLYNKNKPKLPKNPIVEFDKKVLKAISEQSLINSNQNLHEAEVQIINSTPKRTVVSTPNLAEQIQEEEDRRKSSMDIARKGSSTSGVSDVEEKTRMSLRSFNGSNRGVHFSPVVSEVNWRDDSVSTVTPDRESSYSLGSSSSGRGSPALIKPRAVRMSYSQPDLSDDKKEFVDSLKKLRQDFSKSQPDVAKFKRRGSQLIKKDEDGTLVKAYIDRDGIQYKHTHLDIGFNSQTTTAGLPHQFETRPPHERSSTSTVQKSAFKSAIGSVSSVNNMEARDAHREIAHAHKDSKQSKASGKLGGFFSRLASFRFSLRKGAEEKAKLKKKKNVADAPGVGNAPVTIMAPQQRVASKSDYIYIPLKGPSVKSDKHNNNEHSPKTNSVTSKPPLPKQPPRVVHASVKSSATASGADRQQRADNRQQRRRTIDSSSGGCPLPMEPMGLIETDLDTEVTVITSGANVKTRSLLDLGAQPHRLTLTGGTDQQGKEHRPQTRPHKSMEFLLDKQNLKVVEPPENELQKGERVMSEHQLRVQRSLQKLTLPEWYKQSPLPREGFLLKKQSTRETRWNGTGSKTTSLSSLGSNTFSPIVSPTPLNQPFVRWSTSKLNSTASSPCASTRSSFNTRQPNGSISPSSARSSFSYRQPYLGWRSQERLSRPRTPAERLASSLLSAQNATAQQESPEIQTSIKEVTSAIVHYVSGLRPEDARDRSYDSQETASQRSSSVSPRGSQKLCWVESSFVGTRPLDSPQTPVTLSESQSHTPITSTKLRLDLQTHNDVAHLSTTTSTSKPSPTSTTLEDVLDSLLGLPSSGRAPSPSLQETVSANTSPCHKSNAEDPSEQFRRRSEGSEPSSNLNSRRVSFSSSPVLRCRYSRCGRTVLISTSEASAFKNCHNCSYTYCSRACRRAHWEKHRKTCLFSRIGTLCRQVIASCKEKKDVLSHLSKIARRGYLSHGIGSVKCFFPNPESAEQFISNGLPGLGELTYVRWQDLLPSEMGSQLYAELVKMCKNYNPNSKLVLYVSICVISESPATGSVKWERQLVSRCAKMRLSKDIQIQDREPTENTETLILTSAPIETDPTTTKEIREKTVENLKDHLRNRGVSLKRQQPEIHKQLVDYCSNVSKKFTPVTMYPKDNVSGKNLMCILMLDANQESVREIENAGVKVKTIDLLKDFCKD